MRIQHAACGSLLLVAALGLVGCGSNEPTVSGMVTVDGKRLPEGSITFFPADGKTHTAGGKVFDGHYSMNVPAGHMKVNISGPKIIGYKKLYNRPGSAERPLFGEALPAKYNEKTELTLDVKPGTNEKNFELQSK
jgi:hypothetical protein